MMKRKLYIISCNPDIEERKPYNPMKDMDIVQIADLLCYCSTFSEEHYRAHFSTWIKAVLSVLKKAGIPFSLEAIDDFYRWEDFIELVESLKEQEVVSQDEYRKLIRLKTSADIALNTEARFLDLLQGEEGQFLFCNSINAISCYEAKNDAVVFLDLDNFKYKNFTSILGKFFIADIKNIIPREKEANEKIENVCKRYYIS